MRLSLRLPAVLVALATMVSLSGCDSGDDNADARSRLLNVSSGYQSLDLYVNEDDSDSDSLKASAVSFAGLSGYSSVESGTYDIKFKRAGVSGTLLTLSDKKLADDSNVTYVAYGAVGRFGVLEVGEGVEEPDDNGRTKIQAINVSEAGSLDIYLTDSDVPLDDASPLFAGASGAAAMVTTDRGDYRLRVTGANDTSDVRLDIPSITASLPAEGCSSLRPKARGRPDGTQVWVGCRAKEIAIVDLAQNKVADRFPTGNVGLARVKFVLNGKYLLGTDGWQGNVILIDAATRQIVKTLQLGQGAEAIFVEPAGRQALISVTGENYVAEVNLPEMTVGRRISTGLGPDAMAAIHD